MCVVKIFQGDKKGIKTSCKVIVKPYITMPRAEYLSEGQWVVATTNVLKISILCETSKWCCLVPLEMSLLSDLQSIL
jgi:hypothetical protein